MTNEDFKPDPELINIKLAGFNLRKLCNEGANLKNTNKLKTEAQIKNKYLFVNKKGELIDHLNNI